jgi:Zn-dependent protease
MLSLNQNSIHLFRVSGIDVYMHWSWFIFILFEIEARKGAYSSPLWNAAEYLGLFAIVLLHEFGHALACRQVGGEANRIMLWPLGGVAYVNPPQRAGALLWSIAAGPLVNVALLPVLGGVWIAGRTLGWHDSMPDLYLLVRTILTINIGLLVFNILPVYPLDGGQILRALLWFPLGRARSLMVASVLGMFGVLGFIALAIWDRSVWLAIISIYLVTNCWSGFKQAQALRKMEQLPRRRGFACPSCRTAPPIGRYWGCGQCKEPFDTFEAGGVCPNCSNRFESTTCLDCRRGFPMREWVPESAKIGVLNQA